MTQKEPSESIKTRAYKNLRFRIITQDLPPGELLKEKELQAYYGIGRTPLREILIELSRQGLIRRVPRSGTWVAPMDIHFVQQIMEVRIPLEGLAGELAARRITDEQLDQLERILAKVELSNTDENNNLQQLIEYESGFHHIIYAATQNQKLEDILYEFQGISARFWHYLFFTKEQMGRLFDDQRKMLAALKEHDARKCRDLMINHALSYYEKLTINTGSTNGKEPFL